MKCLAVNTANTILSVALCDGGKTLYFFETPETRDQGGLLLGHVQMALGAAGIGYDGIDLMAVGTGPGSFTGIRIGIAAMRALAMAANKPIVGLNSFDLFSVSGEGALNIIAIEAWREELYFQSGNDAPVNEAPDVFARRFDGYQGDIVISGDAAEKLAPHLPKARLAGAPADARHLAQKAAARFTAEGAAAHRPAPFYLRPADVTISANKNRHIEGQ